MILFVHGAAGGWDELIIAAVAFAVLWIAVKLAGRKPAEDGDEPAEVDEALAETAAEHEATATPPASKSH